jgi:hypothetical protein
LLGGARANTSPATDSFGVVRAFGPRHVLQRNNLPVAALELRRGGSYALSPTATPAVGFFVRVS